MPQGFQSGYNTQAHMGPPLISSMFIFSLIQAANTENENDILVLRSENSNWCTNLWKRFAFVVVWIGEVVIVCFLVLLIRTSMVYVVNLNIDKYFDI